MKNANEDDYYDIGVNYIVFLPGDDASKSYKLKCTLSETFKFATFYLT